VQKFESLETDEGLTDLVVGDGNLQGLRYRCTHRDLHAEEAFENQMPVEKISQYWSITDGYRVY